MMCAPSKPRAALGDELDDSTGVLHRPAVRDVTIVLYLDRNIESLCHSLVFSESDGSDLRIGEYRSRYVSVVGDDHRLGVLPVAEQIVLHDAGLVVGDMLEQVRRRDIAQRKNPTRRSPLVLVDYHPAVLDIDTGLLGIQQVGVGHPACRYQQ